jgi:hypothetical protein
MRPYDANTHTAVAKLSRDNYPAENDVWSILVSEDRVSLHAPEGGAYVVIPTADFRAIVDWYMADQKTAKAKA